MTTDQKAIAKELMKNHLKHCAATAIRSSEEEAMAMLPDRRTSTPSPRCSFHNSLKLLYGDLQLETLDPDQSIFTREVRWRNSDLTPDQSND
jgi:hypothetical protein